MAREALTPSATNLRDGVSVAWSSNGKRCYHAVVNLHVVNTTALNLERGDKVMVERCVETNRIWIRRADPTEHLQAWALYWRHVRAPRSAVKLRLTLPGIYGDKRPAQHCAHRLRQTERGPELEIDMPGWAQPPSARRAALEKAA
jgi:hypothetical protein